MKPLLTIYLNEDKTIGVNGPLEDKTACLGLLELAKLVLAEHWRRLATEATEQRIVPAVALPNDLIQGWRLTIW